MCWKTLQQELAGQRRGVCVFLAITLVQSSLCQLSHPGGAVVGWGGMLRCPALIFHLVCGEVYGKASQVSLVCRGRAGSW